MSKTKLTVIIPVHSLTQAAIELEKLPSMVDCVELRFDYLTDIDMPTLKIFRQQLTFPCIFTLRPKSQGGVFQGTETERLQLLKELMQLQPDYIDVESDLGQETISQIAMLSERTKLICSWHNFRDTPDHLEEKLAAMQHPAVTIYKLICTANNAIDACRLLNFLNQQQKQLPIVTHCMGEAGIFSRIAGAILGNYFTYAALHDDSAVVNHQITLKQFVEQFHLPEKNQQTRLYALIGDPVSQSLGDTFHNHCFKQYKINALYLKIKLTENEVTAFFQHISTLPLAGLSITMPLKQAVIPYAENGTDFLAINTLKRTAEGYCATNTDGIGAIKAILQKTSIKDKTVLILGAGGAAHAIMQALTQQQPKTISICNRTVAKANLMAENTDAKVISWLAPCHCGFDIIINTLPVTAFKAAKILTWLATLDLHLDGVLMDINYNKPEQPLEKLIRQPGQTYLDGHEMFAQQALAQLQFWFG